MKDKYFTELHFAKYHGKGFKYEILNVRAEKRESRDIDQDLADIENGLHIVHMSDLLTSEKEAKRNRRAKAKKQRIEKLLKLCSTVGYDSLPDGEKIRIQRALKKGNLTFDEIIQAEKRKNETPTQLSLFEEDDNFK